MLFLSLCLSPCPHLFCLWPLILSLSLWRSFFSLLNLNHYFFLPGKIQEVIVHMHFPCTSVSPFPSSPPSPSVFFPFTSPCQTSVLLSCSSEAGWPHVFKSGLTLSQRNIEVIAQQKYKEKLNSYSTILRSLSNICILIFHIPSILMTIWPYKVQS